jgi:hypothetical protein
LQSNNVFRAGRYALLCLAVLFTACGHRAGAAGAQPFQGLYLQTQWAGTAMQYVHYYFWHDGRICQVMPTGGVDSEPADYAKLQQQAVAQKHACGTYQVNGKSMNVHMDGSAAYVASLVNVQGDSFEMNQYATAKVPSYGAGKSIDGTYTGSIVGDTFNTSTKDTFVFHPGGAYQFTSTPIMGGAAKSESGNYKFFGNTLQAGSRKLTAYPFPDGGIMIEGTVYSK